MNTDWEKLSPLQLGQFGEYYAKMEFASYGYEVYTSEVDDHGVDFIAKKKDTGIFYEVQVKSQYKGKYLFVKKDKLVMETIIWSAFFISFRTSCLLYILSLRRPGAIQMRHSWTGHMVSRDKRANQNGASVWQRKTFL